MQYERKNRTPWILWPFKVVLNLVEWIIKLTGRLVAAAIGLVLCIVGFVLTVLIIGAPVGIPLMVFGFLLMVRGIF